MIEAEEQDLIWQLANDAQMKLEVKAIEEFLKSDTWSKMKGRLKAISEALPDLPNINHFEALKPIYLHQGWPGVDLYGLTILQRVGALEGVDIEEELKKKNNIK